MGLFTDNGFAAPTLPTDNPPPPFVISQVRKHCRKRHLEWLRKLDNLAAHDRQLPKPALYCEWGED